MSIIITAAHSVSEHYDTALHTHNIFDAIGIYWTSGWRVADLPIAQHSLINWERGAGSCMCRVGAAYSSFLPETATHCHDMFFKPKPPFHINCSFAFLPVPVYVVSFVMPGKHPWLPTPCGVLQFAFDLTWGSSELSSREGHRP